MEGIKNKITPPPPVEEDVNNFTEKQRAALDIDHLPRDLYVALKEMENDPLIEETIGTHCFNRFLEGKYKEWREYDVRSTNGNMRITCASIKLQNSGVRIQESE